MNRQRWIWSLAAFGGLCSLFVGRPAHAQDPWGQPEGETIEVQRERVQIEEPVDEPFYRETRPARIREAVFVTETPDPNRPRTMTPAGMALSIGGGISDFTGTARRATDIGGAWDVRLNLGTRTIIGAELAYVGSAQNVDAVGLDSGAALLGNGAEAAARLNFLSGMWQPYIFGGVGWMNYSIVNADFNASALSDNDNLITFPVGAGLAMRYRGLVLDARGTFRPVVEDDMFPGTMHTWRAQLNAGWEF